jgi:hypothetical protein
MSELKLRPPKEKWNLFLRRDTNAISIQAGHWGGESRKGRGQACSAGGGVCPNLLILVEAAILRGNV